MKTKFLALLLSFGLVACGDKVIDYRNVEIVNKQIYAQGENSSFTGKVTNVPFDKVINEEVGRVLNIYARSTGDGKLLESLVIVGINAMGNSQQKNSLLLCDIKVNNGILDGDVSCHLNGKEDTILKYKYSNGKLDGTLTLYMPTNKNEDIVKVAEAEMSNGTLNGKTKVWSARTGKQVLEITMKDGLANGTTIQNGANGKTFQQETYESGKILKTTYFNPSTGKEIGSVNQDAQGNIINGTSVTYYAFNNAGLLDEPKIIDIKEYQNSKPSGKVIQYDVETGKILSELTFKDGSPYNGLYYRREPDGRSIKNPPEEYINGETKSQIEARKRIEEAEAQRKKLEEESQIVIQACIERLKNDENYASYDIDVLESECQQELNGMSQ